MAQCPLCGTPVKEDFGLIECDGCSVQLIVHADGRVECQGAEEAPAHSGVNEEDDFGGYIGAHADEGVAEEAHGGDFAASAGEEPPISEPEIADYNFEEDAGPVEPAIPAYHSASSPSSSDLSDVARFGNSDLSGSRDGALRYTLFIAGIDTSDVRAAFREALTDRKFVWDTDSILRGVRNGEVVIPNVSPSKAHILISRLRSLPVRVRWEQYAIHQT